MTTSSSLPCFKAYDVRGRVPLELNLELVRHIGLAFAAEFAPTTVAVGYDVRHSSRDFTLVLASALQDGGADVVNIGLCGTEEVYQAVAGQGLDGGIMITASHNPKDWNGMKFVRRGAVPVSADSGLHALRDRILAGNLPIALRRGGYERKNLRKEYVTALLRFLGLTPEQASAVAEGEGPGLEAGRAALAGFAGFSIVADAGNGCAGPVLEELGKLLPCRLIILRGEPDGDFPHGVPNPLLPENRDFTAKAVREHGADLGIAFDGDFDRCFFFDETGAFIENYYMVGLLAQYLLDRSPGEKIIYDSRLTWNTMEMVAEAGGTAIESKTGHAFMKERMRAENALYGGEMSGHHYFRDFAFCDGGMPPWLVLLALLRKKGASLSSLLRDRMNKFPVSGELNRSVATPQAIMKRVENRHSPKAKSVTHIDGLSVEFENARFNLRMSNTEPLLRLNVESRGDHKLMEDLRDEILQEMV